MILSPLSLWISNRSTPYEAKKKDGTSITIQSWALWAAIGIFVTPVCWVLAAGFNGSEPTTSVNAVQEVNKAFDGGDGDFDKTLDVWLKKNELSSRWRCEGVIKETLRDPGSMETRRVTYHTAPNLAAEPPLWRTRVAVVFGARNGFGGMNVATGRCLFDVNGNLSTFEGVEQ